MMKKNNKKNKEVKPMSFDEVMKFIDSFNFQTKPNPSAKNKVQLENMTELVDVLYKIKDVNVKETDLDKIKKLYEKIKSNLKEDLCFFNVQFVARILREKISKKETKLGETSESLLQIILGDVEEDLNKTIPNFQWQTKYIDEDEFRNLIDAAFSKSKTKENEDNIKVLTNIYTYAILKVRTRKDIVKQVFLAERILAEYIVELKQKTPNEFLLKVIAESLLDKNPKSKIQNYISLYFNSHINDLEKELNSLSKRFDEKVLENESLSRINRQLITQQNEYINSINQLTDENQEKTEQIINLQNELETTANRLTFERNMYETQLRDLRSGLIAGLRHNMQIELNDLMELANGLNQSDGRILKMYIANIEQVINDL